MDDNTDGEANRLQAERRGKVEGVSRTVERVRKGRVPAAADYLQARLLVQERRWAEATTLFEHARAQLASQPDLVYQANLFLGQCYERLEQAGQMFAAYEAAAKDRRRWGAGRLGARGDVKGAEAVVDAALARKPGEARLWATLSDLARRRQDPVRARAILAEAGHKVESPVILRLARARLLA